MPIAVYQSTARYLCTSYLRSSSSQVTFSIDYPSADALTEELYSLIFTGSIGRISCFSSSSQDNGREGLVAQSRVTGYRRRSTHAKEEGHRQVLKTRVCQSAPTLMFHRCSSKNMPRGRRKSSHMLHEKLSIEKSVETELCLGVMMFPTGRVVISSCKSIFLRSFYIKRILLA